MSLPKISIVTPSFNQGMFLDDTIQSVINQNYENIEYVIIDGDSSDNSLDIIKKHEHQLHYWVSEHDKGHGHAINKGFQQTNGEIMAWINSDDKYTQWSLKVVAEIFTQFPDVMWIVGFNSWWNSHGAMTHAKRVPKNIFDFMLGRYNWIQQESVFWRRELWEKAGGHISEDYKLMVDGELWSRFFLHEPLYSVDCILSGYRSHSTNRAAQNYSECLNEMDKAISEMKHKCSKDTLKTYTQLQRLQKIKKYPLINTPASYLARNLIYLSTLKNAQYQNIFWKDEMWTKRNIPFYI